MSTGAEVNRLFRAEKASSASGVQEKGWRIDVRAVRGAATPPAEPSDKPTVKIGESEEASELGAISGSRPLLHHPYLLGVGPDLPLLQNVAQELHGGCVEHALLSLDEEPVL